MKTLMSTALIGAVGIAASHAAADIVWEDPAVFAPFDNAQVDFVWHSSKSGYTGELRWVDNVFDTEPVTMWTNKSASRSQTFRATRLYSKGERVDFQYEVVKGRKDTFSNFETNDWSQFEIDSSDPLSVRVGVEDIRYPRGDMDHNDAVFSIVFSQAVVPAPGALALLGLGGVIGVRRKR
ncbi:MAG: PEP-CTERM sorting domain-containing protein [Erythrobacter sp.]|nr:PEP-CTERM sorting domain-containing protein [Erythrobacter sp.]